MLSLKIKSKCNYFTHEQWVAHADANDRQIIEPGETVEYLAHVPGGMVKVRYRGQTFVIHPAATEELS